MNHLPQITLDTTLGVLYSRENPKDDGKRVALVLCAANPEIAPTSKLARNTKYLYQDSTFSTEPRSASPEQQQTEISRSVAVKYLSLVPQHDAFAACNMPVVLFELDDSAGLAARSKEEAERTISCLVPSQRPALHFFSSPHQISMGAIGADVGV